MNVPKLRFKKFTGEWNCKKLNEIVKFSKGNILSKADLNNEGQYPCILYGQLYTKYHEVIKEIFGRTDRNNKNLIKSKYGDILIPSSGETPIDISTASCILLDNVLIGGDINILSPINSDGRFMSYMISNNKKFEIAKVAQGHSIVHLYNGNLKSIKLSIPSKEEQTKIANFLSLLDKKIELQTKKIEALKLYKLCLKNRVFNESGMLRYKLNNLCCCKASNINLLDIEFDNGKFPIYGATGEIKKISTFQFSDNYIAIVKDGASVGKTIICDGNSSIIATMSAIIPNKIPIYYFNELIENINFSKYIVGSGIPHIYFKDYSTETVKIHNRPRMKLIDSIFYDLSRKITYEEDKLKKLFQLKKGLMQNMFV